MERVCALCGAPEACELPLGPLLGPVGEDSHVHRLCALWCPAVSCGAGGGVRAGGAHTSSPPSTTPPSRSGV